MCGRPFPGDRDRLTFNRHSNSAATSGKASAASWWCMPTASPDQGRRPRRRDRTLDPLPERLHGVQRRTMRRPSRSVLRDSDDPCPCPCLPASRWPTASLRRPASTSDQIRRHACLFWLKVLKGNKRFVFTTAARRNAPPLTCTTCNPRRRRRRPPNNHTKQRVCTYRITRPYALR